MNDDFTLPCKAEEGRFADGDGEDELVDCEMEAAQALACLAHPVSKNDEFLVPGPSGHSVVKLNPLYKGGCSLWIASKSF